MFNAEAGAIADQMRCLEIVLQCVQRRCRLLGLDAPVNVSHNGSVGLEIHEIMYEPSPSENPYDGLGQRLVIMGGGASNNGHQLPALTEGDDNEDEDEDLSVLDK